MIHVGDCLEWLRSLPDNSVDSIVTDPPYGLGKEPDPRAVLRAWLDNEEFKPGGSGFMGRSWDAFVPSPVVWAECLRVLKPGGYLLSFAGTRTYDWIVMGVRLAGFEIRDMVGWIYGCLSDDTEILVDGRWQHYSNAIAGSLALCYDADRDEYQWQPIQELVEYGYDDTAYRIRGDHTDQIVSRNHRCLVERGGGYSFALAETLECEARVPVLESVCDLLSALSVPHEGAGDAQPVLRVGVLAETGTAEDAAIRAQGKGNGVPRVRRDGMEAECVAEEVGTIVLQPRMPVEDGKCPDLDGSQVRPDGRKVSRFRHEGGEESGMERRCDLLSQEWELQADQVRSMPAGTHADGAQGRLHHGAPADRREGDGAVSTEDRSCAPREPRPTGQPAGEPVCVFQQPGSQAVRGAGHTRSDLARVEPIHYRGKVWCIRVPSGAFVARRNGKAFVTGNSGFPKSLDVSKAIDSMMGVEREVVGRRPAAVGFDPKREGGGGWSAGEIVETAPATEAAQQWAGFGTALKPAIEPIVWARKPLDGTVAANVLKWGTGGINVDGGRVGIDPARETYDLSKVVRPNVGASGSDWQGPAPQACWKPGAGRFPANIIHDGSPEVLGVFPVTTSGGGNKSRKSDTSGSTCYGTYGAPPDDFRDIDTGSAARFFYQAKASRSEREHGLDDLPHGIVDPTRAEDSAARDNPRAGAGRKGTGRANTHPTVKPVDLMRYLIRLVTPPGGLTIDPYAGSGTTGVAAALEGFRFMGAEMETPHALIAVKRIEQAVADEKEERELATMQGVLF